MLDLISRLREPLSEQGRADFVQATVLSCVVGAVRGVSLVAFIPAVVAIAWFFIWLGKQKTRKLSE